MSEILIVDTSVLLNVLNVPGFNQHRNEAMNRFDQHLSANASFLLPTAAVFETGNHIAHIHDGRQRRRYAEKFRDQVRKALNGEAPWTLIPLPESREFAKWLEDFPDCAMREIGMADLSIVKEWEATCARHPHRRIRIWSFDTHLVGYDTGPS